ncbi:hypothetical protein ATANTOWER_022412 [Ataeniobius toweri]|uniref:Uncharacterized protein n=1 Tax=Ataeniobius toweri TaxID=208326 RepID=A0ABU7C0G9_9TELE|nr:hypothetical protein [Ataeniobius toweri]
MKRTGTFNEILTKKKEKLAVVYQVLHDDSEVTLHSKAEGSGHIKSLIIHAKSSRKDETKFTVPKTSTFAFGLMEITAGSSEIGMYKGSAAGSWFCEKSQLERGTSSEFIGRQNLEHTNKKYCASTNPDIFSSSILSQEDEDDP